MKRNRKKTRQAIQTSLATGHADKARQLCEHFLLRDSDDVDILAILGTINTSFGNWADAEKCWTEIVRLQPTLADGYNRLAEALIMQRRFEEAIPNLRQLLLIDPNHCQSWRNLAEALITQGKLQEAVQCFRESLKLYADLCTPQTGHASQLHPSTSPGKGKLQTTTQRKYSETHSSILFYLNNHPELTPADLFSEHQRWEKTHTSTTTALHGHKNLPDINRPLRVGYVSCDLYRHSVSYFFEPLLKGHHREKWTPKMRQ